MTDRLDDINERVAEQSGLVGHLRNDLAATPQWRIFRRSALRAELQEAINRWVVLIAQQDRIFAREFPGDRR